MTPPKKFHSFFFRNDMLNNWVRKKMKFKLQSSFTLIELLVAISIISLLSSIILVFLEDSKGKARDVVRIQNLKEVGKALEMYKLDHGNYPVSVNSDWVPAYEPYTTFGENGYIPNLAPTYIKVLPVDPKQTETMGYLYKSDGNDYFFVAYGTFEGNPPTSFGVPAEPESKSVAVYTPGFADETIGSGSGDLALAPPCYSFGDVNSDGYVTRGNTDENGEIIEDGDAVLIEQYWASGGGIFSIEQEIRADVNSDGQINNTDALWVSQYANKSIDFFPVCNSPIPPCASYGDVDDDGMVTFADAKLIELRSINAVTFTPEQNIRANVDNLMGINGTDALWVKQYNFGAVESFPVCES